MDDERTLERRWGRYRHQLHHEGFERDVRALSIGAKDALDSGGLRWTVPVPATLAVSTWQPRLRASAPLPTGVPVHGHAHEPRDPPRIPGASDVRGKQGVLWSVHVSWCAPKEGGVPPTAGQARQSSWPPRHLVGPGA